MIKPLGKRIVFKFNESVRNGMFSDSTQSGIYLGARADHSAHKPRFGIVEFIGDEVTSVRPGDTVLIDALRWSEGITYNDTKHWLTTEDELLGIWKDGSVELFGDAVGIVLERQKETTTSFGLVIPTNCTEEQDVGIVSHLGPKVTDLLIGDKVLHERDVTIRQKSIELGDIEVSFIKFNQIIAVCEE